MSRTRLFGNKGFSLMELVIVIVIIGILAVVSIPAYHSYVRKSMATEGMELLGAIAKLEGAYISSHDTYADNTIIRVDNRTNRYFTTYTITVSGSFQAGNAAFSVNTSADAGTNAEGIACYYYQAFGGKPIAFAEESDGQKLLLGDVTDAERSTAR
jgi:prepilin-type N-terminal cleavage/methylation domain-containing protein